MKRIKSILNISFFFLLLFVLYECAHRVAPQGGPKDETPPEILSFFPNADTTGITDLEAIEINFSEGINRSSINKNYWLVPELQNPLQANWKGDKKIKFEFKDTLTANQTYLFKLGTAIKDLRGNVLEAPFELAFSTGSHLDSGKVSGRVFSDKRIKDVFIYAYPLNETSPPDTLLQSKSTYFTQIDKDGYFSLSYLPINSYRLFALKDEDYNFIYNIGGDLAGFPSKDIELIPEQHKIQDINFFLIQEDTIAPKIERVDTLSSRAFSITFSEDVQNINPDQIWCLDSLGKKTPEILSIVRDKNIPDGAKVLLSDTLVEQKITVAVLGIKDLAENIQRDTLKKTIIMGKSTQLDSAAVKNILPSNNSENVDFLPEITVGFTVPVDTPAFSRAFALADEKEQPINGEFDFTDISKPVFIPDEKLIENADYFIRLNCKELSTIYGAVFKDTVISSKFTVKNSNDFGGISGFVKKPEGKSGQIYVYANPTKNKKLIPAIMHSETTFEFNDLNAGTYLLQGFLDTNGNQLWDKGSSLPWEFAEPFFFHPDTIKVRRRWTKEGISVSFGK